MWIALLVLLAIAALALLFAGEVRREMEWRETRRQAERRRHERWRDA